jgi:transcriptional regulator with XRE-family HTH domain
MIGRRLNELRKARALSLRELAEATGLSATLLSQIERGVTEPSLKSLRLLAEVFGQSVSTLFEHDEPSAVTISRPGERSRITSPVGEVQYERITPGNGQLEVLRGSLGPGERSGEALWAHRATECAYVLKGSLTVDIGDESYCVSEGEAVTFDSLQPHRYRNLTDSDAEFLISVTPPTP